MAKPFFSDWQQLGVTVAATAGVYAFALTAIRVAGRRTLAQMSAFDVIVTVAVGTVVASTALPSTPSIMDGVGVLATLLVLQTLVAGLRQRFPALRRLVDFRPYVIVRHGQVDLRRNPLSAQLTEDDVWSKARLSNVFALDDVEAVILEPNGKISVVPRGGEVDSPVVEGVLDDHDRRAR